jgi:hypothetical protein
VSELERSVIGQELLGLLPAIYRTRVQGDLADDLDACGQLLDLMRHMLDQRWADLFPVGGGTSGRQVQGWLLPYVADVVDVRLLSPYESGRHCEVTEAVGWRQRKGTLAVLEDVTAAVGATTPVAQDGWRHGDQPGVGGGEFGVRHQDAHQPHQRTGDLRDVAHDLAHAPDGPVDVLDDPDGGPAPITGASTKAPMADVATFRPR